MDAGTSQDCEFQQESDVPIDRIVDAEYIPSDEDTELRRPVDEFQNPSVEDADPFGVPSQFDLRFKFPYAPRFNGRSAWGIPVFHMASP